jgi:hypothetical protein
MIALPDGTGFSREITRRPTNSRRGGSPSAVEMRYSPESFHGSYARYFTDSWNRNASTHQITDLQNHLCPMESLSYRKKKKRNVVGYVPGYGPVHAPPDASNAKMKSTGLKLPVIDTDTGTKNNEGRGKPNGLSRKAVNMSKSRVRDRLTNCQTKKMSRYH